MKNGDGTHLSRRMRQTFSHMDGRNQWLPSPLFSASGFSLLELVVVVVILGILTAAVTPIFSGALGGTKVDHSIRDLVATLKYAQAAAVNEVRDYRVYFNETDNTYWLMALVDIQNGEKIFDRTQDQYGDVWQLPPELRFESIENKRRARRGDAAYIAFYPSGASDISIIKLRRAGLGRERYEIRLLGTLSQFEIVRK